MYSQLSKRLLWDLGATNIQFYSLFFFKLLTVSPLPSGLSFWLCAIIWYESCGFWRTQIGEKVASEVGCNCSLA